MSEEVLEVAEERREVKGNGEMERCNRQKRKGEKNPFECRIPMNSKER